MERPPIVRQEADNGAKTDAVLHEESLAFAQKHLDFFNHYANGKVRFAPAPQGLDTFAFDLKENTIYLNDRFYRDVGLSEEKTLFAILHEVEHFQEKLGMLTEQDGERTFERYLGRIERSRAFGLMDNCVADVRENGAVVENTHSGFRDIEQSAYEENLFSDTDFTKAPEHIQFCQAYLCEGRFPDRQCAVSPEVRAKLDEVCAVRGGKSGARLTDIMANQDTLMSVRLKLQDRFIWPIVESLLKKDLEREQEKKQGGKGDGEGDKGGEQGEPQQGGTPEKGEGEQGAPQEGGAPQKGAGKPADPNEVFADAYAEAEGHNPHAVPTKDIRKAFEDWKKEHGDKNALEIVDAEHAAKLGVSKEALKNYRKLAEHVRTMRDPETGAHITQELHNLFSRIISKRFTERYVPKHPVEEGEYLVDPAELVSQVKAGNFEPKAWETEERAERTGGKFGEVEITLVCDRSGSMKGQKLIEQQRAAVLVMEALKEFSERAEEERVNTKEPLEVRAEVYSFQATSEDAVPLKTMSKEFGEGDRIRVADILGSAPGDSTTDFNTLAAIERALNEEAKRKMKDGELKKIIFVLTDGESDNPDEVQTILARLRASGVVAVGIGITKSGEVALETYAPDARVAETAERLPIVMADLLKEHLEGV